MCVCREGSDVDCGTQSAASDSRFLSVTLYEATNRSVNYCYDAPFIVVTKFSFSIQS